MAEDKKDVQQPVEPEKKDNTKKEDDNGGCGYAVGCVGIIILIVAVVFGLHSCVKHNEEQTAKDEKSEQIQSSKDKKKEQTTEKHIKETNADMKKAIKVFHEAPDDENTIPELKYIDCVELTHDKDFGGFSANVTVADGFSDLQNSDRYKVAHKTQLLLESLAVKHKAMKEKDAMDGIFLHFYEDGGEIGRSKIGDATHFKWSDN